MTLDHQDIEAIVQRLTEVLSPMLPTRGPQGLVDARALAEHLGLSRDWVYRHQRELGGQRIGTGPKAPLRFHLPTAEAGLNRNSPAPRRRPPRPSSVPLLPVR